MDMELANLILGALTAGAVASVKDTTSQVGVYPQLEPKVGIAS